ncbi:MAG: universal stress protein [Thaumarchaeota archaeon]|nr:universal stress protein [Nitrososphaerota archaeon]
MQIGKFSKILVAIDGSPKSMEAADHGIVMAKKDNAKIVVISVIHTPASILTYSTEKSFKEFLKKTREETEEWFSKIRKKASEIGVELKTDTVEEIYSIPGAIIKYAEQGKFDVIIVGGTGKSGFKKFLLGSVSGDVVRYARCHVLVIK